jgi:hypothetical protein
MKLLPDSKIPPEYRWAYTPEHRARIERARRSADVRNITEDDLAAIINANDPEAAARALIAARLTGVDRNAE